MLPLGLTSSKSCQPVTHPLNPLQPAPRPPPGPEQPQTPLFLFQQLKKSRQTEEEMMYGSTPSKRRVLGVATPGKVRRVGIKCWLEGGNIGSSGVDSSNQPF